MLSKTSAYVKSYDRQTIWMYVFIEYDELLEKHNTMWDIIVFEINSGMI